jgi:Lipocalin-like domain
MTTAGPVTALDLVGTWRVLTMEYYDADGTVGRPFGDHPEGFITYTPEGYMMALLSRSDREPFVDGDIMGGTPDEQVSAFLTASSFAGRYEVIDNQIHHHLEAASFPNWKGTTQPRDFDLTATHLSLYPPPLLMAGQLRSSRVQLIRLPHW